MDNKEKLHIAVFPWLPYGHIMPFFKGLSSQLKMVIIFISTPNNMHRFPQIPDNLSSHLNFVQLPLPHAQGLPQGAESTAYFPIHQVPYVKQAQDMLQLALINFLKNSRSPPEIINGRRQQPEDFTVVPEWINFDFNISFKLHEIRVIKNGWTRCPIFTIIERCLKIAEPSL
ncbi:hypothetical protein Pint_13426 [Pistacia integerrima]|uniref:Uncharacterized protein n=1 Tax=Pistacia integerrima TaxID=434235 RepID=A0ACC0Y7V0_9ROSI|nr:hypothetical protein Pint_13426 [Pistacia integerrima]